MKIAVTSALLAAMLASTGFVALAQQGHGAQHQDQQQQHGPQQQSWHEQKTSRGHNFRKGQRLAPAQRRYVISDWNKRGLRTPPRGYQWVRENDNSGDYLLVVAATGLIASILGQ